MTARTPSGLMTNWTRLLWLILRRDRASLPVWIVAVVVFGVAFLPAIPHLMGTSEETLALAEMMKNPAVVALCGITYGDDYTIGIMYTQMMLVWTALLAAAMNIFVVIRHTRADEDEGRLEVVRSLPVGRLANLGAVSVLAVGVNLVLFLLTGLAMVSFGMESVDLPGSLAYGAAVGACGLVSAGLTIVVVQLVHSARTGTGVSLGLLGVFYLVRAYGDVSSETAARISPLGLIERTYPYYQNQWWPIFLLVGVSVVLTGAGFALNWARDLGAGLLPPLRHARAHAPRSLSTEWGLAWRLTRTTIIAWSVTVFVFAAAYGSIMGDMESFVLSNPLYQQMMGVGEGTVDLVGPMVLTMMLIMGVIGVIPVLTTAYKLHSEERKGRLDYVLGKTVSRVKLFAGYAVLVAGVGLVMQILSALGFYLVAMSVMDDPLDPWLVVKVAANLFPALLAFGGLGLFLVGWAKRFTWIGWGYLAATFLVDYMGSMMDLPRWAGRFTPFGLLQRWPMETFSWWGWIGLMVGSVLLAVVGAMGFRRRDVTA